MARNSERTLHIGLTGIQTSRNWRAGTAWLSISVCAKRSMPKRIVPRSLMRPKWAGTVRRSQSFLTGTPLDSDYGIAMLAMLHSQQMLT